MITFKEYLNEDAGDRAAQTDREWLAKKIDLIELVKKQLNDSVRVAHNLNLITSATVSYTHLTLPTNREV